MARTRLAFYDLDGTLVSSNVVTQYAFYLRGFPSRPQAWFKYSKLLLSVPFLIGLDLYSRRLFNQVFFREYRGLSRDWLHSQADDLFRHVIEPAIFPGAKSLVEADRAKGYQSVLVTGSLDCALEPVLRYFGFDHVICNTLDYENGTATGRVMEPLIAEREKVNAMLRMCAAQHVDAACAKAYSDSLSDLPMLEAVGLPAVVNPGRRMKRVAAARGWPTLDLKTNKQASAEPAEAERAESVHGRAR